MVDKTTLNTLGVWVRLSAVTGALWNWLKNCIGRNEHDDRADCERDQISPQELYRTTGLVRLNGRVWHQGNVPSSFYSHGYLPLVSGTVARNPPWNDLSSLCNKVFEHFRIFIVDLQFRIRAESTNLTPRKCPSFSPVSHHSLLYHDSFFALSSLSWTSGDSASSGSGASTASGSGVSAASGSGASTASACSVGSDFSDSMLSGST